MKPQNYKNHVHLVPLYHYATFTAMAIMLVGAVVNLIQSKNDALMSWLFLLTVVTLISVSFHNRSFALKAQDRAIRAEENFRYYVLTGKLLSRDLTIYQIIALRFASDEEFVSLAIRASAEKMSPRAIKKSIKNWRPDYHRA